MRAVLAEDLVILRDGLVRALEDHGIEVVAAVDNGSALLEALAAEAPDVAIVDVRLPPTFTDEGLRAAVTARTATPGLPIVVLSQYVEPLYARELLEGGAGIGYLLKDRITNTADFVDAVRRVAGGATVMDPHVISRLLGRHDTRGTIAGLTDRERNVLALMAEGHSNVAIASRLFVSESAVAKHTTSIFTKLDLLPDDDANRRVLAVLAYLNR